MRPDESDETKNHAAPDASAGWGDASIPADEREALNGAVAQIAAVAQHEDLKDARARGDARYARTRRREQRVVIRNRRSSPHHHARFPGLHEAAKRAALERIAFDQQHDARTHHDGDRVVRRSRGRRPRATHTRRRRTTTSRDDGPSAPSDKPAPASSRRRSVYAYALSISERGWL